MIVVDTIDLLVIIPLRTTALEDLLIGNTPDSHMADKVATNTR